ncbi:MAG: hypothetical protein RLZZ546_2708, partial [Bacteroidota bacterium]
MERFQKFLSHFNFGLFILFLFLFLFHHKMVLPENLHFLGRLHPMIVHLPIGMFFINFLLYIFQNKFNGESYDSIYYFILSFSNLASLLSSIAGLFLSLNESYDSVALKDHKYLAAIFVSMNYLLYILYKSSGSILKNNLIYGSLILIILTGHFGANISHGKDYLFPSKSTSKNMDNGSLYELCIMPVLKQKCYSCHNSEKKKGDLILTDITSIKKGGKEGQIINLSNLLESRLLTYLHLPLNDEKHMPPDGKIQLTNDEKKLLRLWVKSGASFDKKINEYDDSDSIRIISAKFISPISKPKSYAFSHANADLIKKLNSPFLSLRPIAEGSPALEASIFVNSAFDINRLKELKSVKDQLIHLNLSNIKIDQN